MVEPISFGRYGEMWGWFSGLQAYCLNCHTDRWNLARKRRAALEGSSFVVDASVLLSVKPAVDTPDSTQIVLLAQKYADGRQTEQHGIQTQKLGRAKHVHEAVSPKDGNKHDESKSTGSSDRNLP